MHRFHVPQLEDGAARFSRAQLHQLRRVLRLRDGDTLAVFDGQGREWVCRLQGDCAELLAEVERHTEPSLQLMLCQALIKPPAFELVLQKGTELGVSCFVPVVAARSVHVGDRMERWRAIVAEAAEQCGRQIVPRVSPPLSFAAALEKGREEGPLIVPWEGCGSPTLASVFAASARASVVVGPEGGFTAEEIERARAAGAHIISLGRRVLRSETAAIVAAALLFHLSGDL